MSEGVHPRCGTIGDAVTHTKLSRSRLYELAKRWPGLFKKNGRRTLVDYMILDQVIDSLPVAELKPDE